MHTLPPWNTAMSDCDVIFELCCDCVDMVLTTVLTPKFALRSGLIIFPLDLMVMVINPPPP